MVIVVLLSYIQQQGNWLGLDDYICCCPINAVIGEWSVKLEQQYRSHKQESVGRVTANAQWLCGTSVAPRVSNDMGIELYTHTLL